MERTFSISNFKQAIKQAIKQAYIVCMQEADWEGGTLGLFIWINNLLQSPKSLFVFLTAKIPSTNNPQILFLIITFVARCTWDDNIYKPRMKMFYCTV